jgi:hypothetical protein
VDGPGSVDMVALDEGHIFNKLSPFLHFWNSFLLLSADVYVSSVHNMRLSTPVNNTSIDCTCGPD